MSDAVQQIREHVQQIVDLLPALAGPINHLEPIARDVRNDVLMTLMRCREEFSQPPVVDLWALSAAMLVVIDRTTSLQGG